MDTDFLKLAAARYSVRKFRPDPVEPEKLDLIILRAGNLAPTACNLQPQRILVLSSEESLDKLRRCTRCHLTPPPLCWSVITGRSAGNRGV